MEDEWYNEWDNENEIFPSFLFHKRRPTDMSIYTDLRLLKF